MTKQPIRYLLILTLGLLAIAAEPLLAQTPTPAGSEFQVNTYTTNNQWRVAAATSAMGDFVITWSSTNQDGSSNGVFAQRYDSAGSSIGGEFQVNATTGGSQSDPDVAMDAEGGFVVVWGTGDIIGQRFSRLDTKIGGEFTVNSTTLGSQIQPEIAMNHAGEFVVAWNSDGQDGSSWGIFGRRFTAGGGPVGGEFQANTTTASYQIYPNVAIDDDGAFLVVWNSTYSETYGQLFTSGAAKTGGELQVNTYTTSSQRNTDAAYDLSGEFVVVWRSYGQDGAGDGVFGQRFSSTGSKIGGEFQANAYTTGNQSIAALGRSADGDTMVIWTHSEAVNTSDVRGRLLTAAGTAVGSEFQANTYTTARQGFVKGTMDDAGNFVAVWVSDDPNGVDQDGDQSGVFAQRLQSPCSLAVNLPTGQWKMVALPCDPGASNTVADVFDDDMTGTYGVDWIVYERNEAADSYAALTLGSALEAGVGYWIKTLDAGETIDVGSGSSRVTEVDLVADADGRQNLVGHPFDFDVCWEDVRVIDGFFVRTLDQADPVVGPMRACDMVPPDSSCIMSRVMYKWNGAYTPFDGVTPGAEGTLEAYDALWVKAFKPGIKLRIPARGSSSCGGSGFAPDPLAAVTEPPAHRGPTLADPWVVRLIAEADGLRDAGNLLGQLDGSLDGRDLHDLVELSPFAAPYLTVVFPQPDWGDQAGDYATDFHARKRRSARDSWVFEVRASPEVEQVTLSWEGPRRKVARLRLRDETAGRRVVMRPGGSYTFTMDGSPRVFTCRLGPGRR